MLRGLLLALVLANLFVFAFNEGLLRSLGWGPENPREPQRLAQQLEPERLRLRPPVEAGRAAKATTPPAAAVAVSAAAGERACWQAGGFDDAQVQALGQALAALPALAGAWEFEERLPGTGAPKGPRGARHTLKLPAITAAQRQALAALGPTLLPESALQPCP